jgi:polar amino acid transport system substrate-binding protein
MIFTRRHIAMMALAGAMISGALCSTNAGAQSADAGAQLAPTGTLRIVLLPLPIIATKDAAGALAGVPVDLGRELAKRLGVPVEFKATGSPAETVDAIKNGDADVTFLVNLPARAALIDFGPSYISYGATYLVPPNSAITSMAEVDQPGRRIIVPEKSAIDAKLGPMLKQAKLVGILPIGPTQTTLASEMLGRNEGDAYSDLHHLLALMQAKLPGSKKLDGHYMPTELQIAYGKSKSVAAKFAANFIADMKASGFIKSAIERAGLQGAKVPE